MTATPAPTEPRRAAVIAAIHAAADFLAAHPEYPTPRSVELMPDILTEQDEIDEKLRVAGLLQWAATVGASLFEGSTGIMATASIATTAEHGVRIEYRRHVNFDRTVARRYVP